MTEASQGQSRFTLGLNAGLIGRWARLILGSVVPLVSIGRLVAAQSPSAAFITQTGLFFALILGVYLVATYALGERLLARANPWVGTLILVGPPTLVLVLGIGPSAFQLALGLYIAISLVFNFTMSYGGCEVMAIPSLVFRRRYVVYCPWNAIDVVDKVIADRARATD